MFGTKGGLTGVLASELEWNEVGKTLRARRTFATTGERLVGLVTAAGKLQGDDVTIGAGDTLSIDYAFFGAQGFASVEAWDATGRIFQRDLQQEVAKQAQAAARKLRVKWGGARLYDRYREAVWEGSILVSGTTIVNIRSFGGVLDNAEEEVKKISETQIIFATHTSGDFDGVEITLSEPASLESVSVSGHLGGYVKVGDALKGNPHKAQPTFTLNASADEARQPDGKTLEIQGGAELFVQIELVPDLPLPRRVEGEYILPAGGPSEQAVYFVGREFSGGKVITSPIFIQRDA